MKRLLQLAAILPALTGFPIANAAPVPAWNATIPELARSRQLIVVTASGWNTSSATVRCFERGSAGESWKPAMPPCAAQIGRNGFAWGIGLHGAHPPGSSGPVKREGDGRAPAGTFLLAEAFGYAGEKEAGVTKFAYMRLTPSCVGVDDMHSRYYNRVVDASRVSDHDWNSAEKMFQPDDVYRRGIVVEHNWQAIPGAGSCIFMHISHPSGKPTSGCTAMAETDIARITSWLDTSRRPVLVQLPIDECRRLQRDWGLP